MKEEKSATTFVLRCFVARLFPSLNSPNSSFQKRKLPFACSTFSRVRDAMVKLYTFHMFNKKVCLSLFSSRFEFLSKQTSFLTLSDADISSLSFPNNTFQGEIVYYHEWSRPYPRNVNVHEETKTLFGLFFTMNQFAMKMDPMKYVLLCNLFRSSLMLSLSPTFVFPKQNAEERSATTTSAPSARTTTSSTFTKRKLDYDYCSLPNPGARIYTNTCV